MNTINYNYAGLFLCGFKILAPIKLCSQHVNNKIIQCLVSTEIKSFMRNGNMSFFPICFFSLLQKYF